MTPISVRGDLREPGGEGRGRLCGEGRGGGRAARGSRKSRAPGARAVPVSFRFFPYLSADRLSVEVRSLFGRDVIMTPPGFPGKMRN